MSIGFAGACSHGRGHSRPRTAAWERLCRPSARFLASDLVLQDALFAELTTRKLRRFAYRSVTALEAGVRRWINERNAGRRIAELTAEHRWSGASEAVAYDMAGEVIGGPAGAPESGTPA